MTIATQNVVSFLVTGRDNEPCRRAGRFAAGVVTMTRWIVRDGLVVLFCDKTAPYSRFSPPAHASLIQRVDTSQRGQQVAGTR